MKRDTEPGTSVTAVSRVIINCNSPVYSSVRHRHPC